jgi:ornithine decarboxylase
MRKPPADSLQELDPAQDPFARASIETLVERYGAPLFLIDAARLRAQYRRLAAALPGVELFYAVKCLPHASVVSTLRDAGASFDLATNGEVELVRRLGVAPERCIHTHPIKRESDIRTAAAFGIRHFVVDNPDELRKFTKFRNRSALLIRVAFPEMLALAAELRIQVQGLSFHAGSQAAGPQMHIEAVNVCRELMRHARELGHELSILDIGGGFPVDYLQNPPPVSIEEFCAPIRGALDSLEPGVRVIAEPGRFIAAPSAIAISSVMGRAERGGRWWYYLDDGLYGSYSGQVFEHAQYPLEALASSGPTFPSVLAGPTCDSVDVIRENIALPKLKQGDLVVGRVMGAYTWASSTEFNFFPRTTVLAIDRGRLIREVDAP